MDPHVADFLEFLRFPSVSTDASCNRHVADCARWLGEKISRTGLDAVVHPTAGHPVIVAKNAHRPGRPTLLVYGHYDVQPADPLELWTSPPFEPRIENDVVFARGATDNKGQIFSHICGIGDALARGPLPLNLTLLIEGEEEVGSQNLEPFLKSHRGELQCDVIAVSDTGMVARGVPTLTYGLRGITAMELKMTGPSSDLHSGSFGGAVANPVTMLARLLATLHDDQGRVAVPGFYDAVRPLEKWEREAWTSLPFGDAELLELTGAPELFGEAGYSPVERTWARPTAEINGLGGGYQGEGTKTVLPKEAFAKLTFRLVPDQRPEVVLEKVAAHLRARCPSSVRLEILTGHSGEPYATDPGSPFGLAARRALQKTFHAEPALIREGGSIPIVNTFKRVLGAETLLLGLAMPDCRAHAPNENFPLENFRAGIRLNQLLTEEIAGVRA